MKQETFINYKNWRWLKITTLLVFMCLIFYFLNDGIKPQSGSSLYGYIVGIVSAGIMIFLLWYGVRKRRYFSSATTMLEVLSAHTWLGLSLLILVPLHAGFRFGNNIHTGSFVLSALTIITGVWGMYLYRVLPVQLKSNRGEGSLKNLIEQFENFKVLITNLEKNKSDAFISFISRFDTYSIKPLPMLFLGFYSRPLSKTETASALLLIPEHERQDILSAISFIDKRFEFIKRIEREALVQAWLKIWLVFHVPVAIGAGFLLVIHIFSVLYYGGSQ